MPSSASICRARGGADLAQPRALADDDALLARPLDEHDGVDVEQVVAALARHHLLDRPPRSSAAARRAPLRARPRGSARRPASPPARRSARRRGRAAGPRGSRATSRSASTSTWSPATADTGTISANSPARRAAMQLLGHLLGPATRSVLVTTPSTGVRPPAGRSSPTMTVARADRLVGRHAEADHVDLGPGLAHQVVEPLAEQRARPVQAGGVDTISWASGRCTMPRIACRVVCGLDEVIAIFAPTSALISVDLPALGRPTKHAKPERKPAGTSGNVTAHPGSCAENIALTTVPAHGGSPPAERGSPDRSAGRPWRRERAR